VRALAFLAALVLLAAAFLLGVRPWYLRWGATDEELRRPLAGDEIIPNAAAQETRAITIRAPIERVWPWLAQTGQDRGGFYSYDLLENLVGCEMPTEDRLRPDKQQWKIGDRLWMYPPGKAGGIGFATLLSYVPGRALGFGTHRTGTAAAAPVDGSWSFALEPLGDTATRLLVRGRGGPGRANGWLAFDAAVFEPAHFAMERRMMTGLKQVVEGGDRHRWSNHVQVVLWILTFLMWLAAAVLVLRRPAWVPPLAVFLAAGVAFQVLSLGQPPLLVGLAVFAATTALFARAAWRTA
jgi:hypothetical protein